MSYSNFPPRAQSHPPPETLHVYGSGGLDPATSVSVELHVQHCDVCRTAVNAAAHSVSQARIDANWFMIAAELDAPRRGIVERTIPRLGLPRDVARLMAATPSLRRSWFIAVVSALLLGMAATNPARPNSSIALFLALAPLVPVIGVALAYGPGVDPAHEITIAAPLSGFRLVLLRTAAVLLTSIMLAGAASLFLLRRDGLIVAAWLLPGLALSSLCLALTTFIRPRAAATIVAVSWLLLAIAVTNNAADQLVLYRGAGQVAFSLLAMAATAAVVVRRRRFDVAAEGSS